MNLHNEPFKDEVFRFILNWINLKPVKPLDSLTGHESQNHL